MLAIGVVGEEIFFWNACCLSFCYQYFIIPIMIQSRTHVKTTFSMFIPCTTLMCLFLYDWFDSKWYHGGWLKVVFSKHFCVCWKRWIDSRLSEKFNGYYGLFQIQFPLIFWECWINTTQASNKVILERLNCTFCWVQTMITWGYNLVFKMIVFNGFYQISWYFIIQSLNNWVNTCFYQLSEKWFVCLYYIIITSWFHCLC